MRLQGKVRIQRRRLLLHRYQEHRKCAIEVSRVSIKGGIKISTQSLFQTEI